MPTTTHPCHESVTNPVFIFDLDGCLYWEGQTAPGKTTWKTQQNQNSTKALIHFGLATSDASKLVNEKRGSALLRHLISHDYCEDTRDNRDAFWNIYNYGSIEGGRSPDTEAQFSTFVRPHPGVVDYVRHLPLHYRKVIYTNGSEKMARNRLSTIGFDPDIDFDKIYGAEFVHPHYKPSEEGYTKVLEDMGVLSRDANGEWKLSCDATFFEDTAANLVFPRHIGMVTVGVMSNHYPPVGYEDVEPTMISERSDLIDAMKMKLSANSDIQVPSITAHHLEKYGLIKLRSSCTL